MKFFHKIIDAIRSPFEKLGQTPEYDWHFALWGFVVGLILVLSINVLVFIKLTSNETGDSSEQTAPTIRLSKGNIDEAIKNIEQRDSDASAIPMEILEDPSR